MIPYVTKIKMIITVYCDKISFYKSQVTYGVPLTVSSDYDPPSYESELSHGQLELC